MNSRTATFPSEVRAGFRVSLISFIWTLISGGGAIAIGLLYRSLVLVAFGAIGLVDALGSASLIIHFRHTLRHEAISLRHERTAHRLVTAGMGTIGLATIGDSAYRLATRSTAQSETPGILVAAASILVLVFLSRSKRQIARRIPSLALNADGWLSAVGAGLAVVALVGTGLQSALGWWWTDPLAAIGMGLGAFGLSIALSRGATSHDPVRD